jgi:hypothetical protein
MTDDAVAFERGLGTRTLVDPGQMPNRDMAEPQFSASEIFEEIRPATSVGTDPNAISTAPDAITLSAGRSASFDGSEFHVGLV